VNRNVPAGCSLETVCAGAWPWTAWISLFVSSEQGSNFFSAVAPEAAPSESSAKTLKENEEAERWIETELARITKQKEVEALEPVN